MGELHRAGIAGKASGARRYWLVAIVFALVGCSSRAEDAVGPTERTDPMLAEMGAKEYQRFCAACHGALGRGDGPVADTLKRGPSDLSRIAARRGGRFPEAEVARFIDGRFKVPEHGSREMPVWGTRLASDIPESEIAESVSRGRIVTLIEYMKSIQRPLISPD